MTVRKGRNSSRRSKLVAEGEVGDDGGLANQPAPSRQAAAAGEAAVALGLRDALAKAKLGVLVDHRSEEGLAIGRIAEFEGRGERAYLRHQVVVDALEDDRARARAALLPGEAEGGATRSPRPPVEVGRGGDDGGVLAAHLGQRRPRVGPFRQAGA